MKVKEFIEFLQKKGYKLKSADDGSYSLKVGGGEFVFDVKKSKYDVKGIKCGHRRIFDLTKKENFSVVMLLLKIFKKGYSLDVITLEKNWQLGHDDGYLDVMLQNPQTKDIYMIEVKTSEEILRYTNLKNERKLKQAFSYAIQDKQTKIVSFYAYDFEADKDYFYNVYSESILTQAQNADDFLERWNKIFDKTDYIVNSPIFGAKRDVKKYANLEVIEKSDTKILYNQFLTILRLHSVSDKPNAFNKMINLFLSKIADEISYNKEFKIKDSDGNYHTFNGLKFQYVEGVDTAESFIKRLNDLYKTGMRDYLNKDVIDYSDEEIESMLGSDNKELFSVIDDLRLKKSNSFSFIDVYDDDTFKQNFEVVKEVVQLLEGYKFKYETKHQFLGDFFEDLLNTSLKQEAGQFFTPYPIVDFMVDSLPFKEIVQNKIDVKQVDFIPKVIDYACGAGHFLISVMSKIQGIINGLSEGENNLTPTQKTKVKNYVSDPFSWISRENLVGIEKDYRLAKTTKIATFLNGDGNAEIISGDGINKFSSKDYENTVLYSNKKKLEKFDVLIANPPFSIDGFMRNFSRNGIELKSGDFTLLKKINYTDSAIEKFFVERAEQLLKKSGYAAIILPQSVLSNEKYDDLRRFIFSNFRLLGLMLTADITFYGTSTSPVVLFLQKEKVSSLDYEILIACSPKYLNPSGYKMRNREIEFLGYEFSSNRDKTGTTIRPDSMLKEIAPYMNAFIKHESIDIKDEHKNNVFVRKVSDVLLNCSTTYFGDLYPKYTNETGVPLSRYCKINTRALNDFETAPEKYVEIGDLSDLGKGSKKEQTTRYCKKGDILVASLCPKKEQIIISDGEYMLSSAIHVLSDFKSDQERDYVYERLRDASVIRQMNSLLDGFKITYAKISDNNLKNNVKL